MESEKKELAEVFPTPVGMNRNGDYYGTIDKCVPHARGDEPGNFKRLFFGAWCSPRPWG